MKKLLLTIVLALCFFGCENKPQLRSIASLRVGDTAYVVILDEPKCTIVTRNDPKRRIIEIRSVEAYKGIGSNWIFLSPDALLSYGRFEEIWLGEIL